MSKTPEGKMKDAVRYVLNTYDAYYSMPVQTGYGDCLLDFHPVVLNGHTFFIETKAAGGRLTARQKNTIEQIRNAGGTVFVVKCRETLKDFARYALICHRSEPPK